MDYLLITLVSTVIIVLIALLINMFLKRWRFGVPFIRTKPQGIDVLLAHLSLQPGDLFVDMWCGDGIVLASVLERFPGVTAIGYEIRNDIWDTAQTYQKKYAERFTLHHASYTQADLSAATVVYCYLFPHHINAVREQMQKECRPRTKLYSYVFALKNIPPIATLPVPVPWKKDDVLYVYEIA